MAMSILRLLSIGLIRNTLTISYNYLLSLRRTPNNANH